MTSLLTLVLFLTTFASVASDEDVLRFSFQETEGQFIDLLDQERPLVRYMLAYEAGDAESRHQTYKPFHHLYAPDGKTLMTKGPGGTFTHHRGMFFGFSQLSVDGNVYDFWHMNNVAQVHQEVVSRKRNSAGAELTTLIHWLDPQANPVIVEQRTVRLHDQKDVYALIDFESVLTAPGKAVMLKGDPEHAGFQYRPAEEVAKNKSAKYTFHTEGIDPKKDRDLPWVAMNYQLGAESYTVQHMNHPSNPSDTVYSAYRDYGRFGAYFVWEIPPGDSVRLRYRLSVNVGPAPKRELLSQRFAAFAGK